VGQQFTTLRREERRVTCAQTQLSRLKLLRYGVELNWKTRLNLTIAGV
jgi:hypothetical protein